MYKEVELTPEQDRLMQITRVAFMTTSPFFCHYMYSEMKEVFTIGVPTLATDGRHVFINPNYICKLKLPERVFAYTHEVWHQIQKHPQRMMTYQIAGKVRDDKPFDGHQVNVMMDYCVNAGLLEESVGAMNPSWLWADDVTGSDLWEDVYNRKYDPNFKSGTRYAGNPKAARSGQVLDNDADAAGGGFDTVMPPPVDPVTGQVDLPTDAQFREAIDRAAGAAKAMGKLPASVKRMVDEILAPQVEWKDHVRMLLTGAMGHRRETWTRPNRRRLALNPMVILPGKRGHGADVVAVGMDTSGSIYGDPKALAAFFSELASILTDIRPKRVIVIECDAAVQAVHDLASLDDLELARAKGVTGGGGTSFVPPFDWLRKEGITPDTLVYLTDLQGTFPKDPGYPVVWCSTTKGKVPFGETVYIKT